MEKCLQGRKQGVKRSDGGGVASGTLGVHHCRGFEASLGAGEHGVLEITIENLTWGHKHGARVCIWGWGGFPVASRLM